MIPRFFIDRPIFAVVLSVFFTLAGSLAVSSLPISQYPQVTPPTIQIDCNYPGASSLVVSQTIASPIEQQVNGVEDMLYMTSQCTSDGSYTLTVTFKPGTDLNMAAVRVQNRVNLAMPQLPEVVRATGITTRKRSPELLLTCGLTSPPEPGYPNGRYDQLYLSNYAVLNLREELQRIPGISDVTIFGQRDYAMRVWLDPAKLAARNLTAGDVVNALRDQNIPLAAGMIGQPPSGEGQPYQLVLTGLGRLEDVDQFERVVVKVGAGSQLLRIRDIGRVELGSRSSDVSNRFDDKPTVGLAIFILPDANSLEVAAAVRTTMERMSKDFPPGMMYEIGYDTSPFIRESISEVFKSLRDAIILVSLVVLLFLQSWRAAVIPLAAVPVAIVGTFAAMSAVGFTVNNLTLFGLVLAVGIVVDDAIVVVEAVQHQMEKGYSPREATLRAMNEVSGPIIAVGVVLSFVFFPCIFISGIVGAFFKQFALTIAVSTLISTFNSLTLSPALCALLLKPKRDLSQPRGAFGKTAGVVLFPFTFVGRAFDRAFNFTGRVYVRIVGFGLRVPLLVLVAYLAIVGAGVAGFQTQPTGFIPQQDKGYMIASIQLPDGASAERTIAVIRKISRAALDLTIDVPAREGEPDAVLVKKPERVPVAADRVQPLIPVANPPAGEERVKARLDGTEKTLIRVTRRALLRTPDGEPELRSVVEWFDEELREQWVRQVKPVAHCNAIAGNSFVLSAYGSNFGSMFIILKGFPERRAPELSSDKVAAALRMAFAKAAPEGQINVFGAPAVSGLGRAGGFRIMIEDRGDVGPETLQGQTENFIDKANQQKQVAGLFTVFKTNSPRVYLDIDPARCVTRGVNVTDVYGTLQGTMGSRYANDFNLFGRTWQVNVQGDLRHRDQVDDIKKLKVRNRQGEMVPLEAVLAVNDKKSFGPLVITRYNMYPAAAVNGNVTPGTSTGDALAVLEKLAAEELPEKMAYEWTELMFLEKQSRNTGALVFALSVAFVFLVLAALYESWAFPFAVILVVPVCVSCSLAVIWITDPGSLAETFYQLGLLAGPPLPGPGQTDAEFLALHPNITAEQLAEFKRLRFYENTWLAGIGRWFDNGPIAALNKWSVSAGIGKQDVNIFTQVGFVVLIGLACKNAILIVEFAKVARDRGVELRTAVLDACKLRYRPIMMTSVAFMLGVLPLALAKGAGAEMRQAIGVAVLGGMLGVTILGIVFTPVFFAVVDRFTRTPLGQHPWVLAVLNSTMYLVRLRFVPPVARAVRDAATGLVRRVRPGGATGK